MANPTLNRHFGSLPENGANAATAVQVTTSTNLPFDPYAPEPMTIGGTVSKTAFLLALVVGAGMFGWGQVQPEIGVVNIPVWWFFVSIGALVLAIVTAFKPAIAKFTGPIYAITQGITLGAISHLYNAAYDGIVTQAILATAAVFVGMLFLFVTGVIKVTAKFRGIVMGATLGVFLFYMISMVSSFLGASMALLGGGVGIGLSVLIVGIAAMNLMLDFDMIVRGTNAGAPKDWEWYGAFGLMVTIVWMYIEILRLIALTRD